MGVKISILLLNSPKWGIFSLKFAPPAAKTLLVIALVFSLALRRGTRPMRAVVRCVMTPKIGAEPEVAAGKLDRMRCRDAPVTSYLI